MNRDTEPLANRRDVLAGLLRGAGLAGLGGMSAYLLARSAGAGAGCPCPVATPCGQCPLGSQCQVPRAVATRDAKAADAGAMVREGR